jgi:hypothetical protein
VILTTLFLALQGYLPTLLEDVPDMAFKFAAYETLKQMHRAAVGGRSPTMAEDFCLGATAGACAAAATTPLDVIKTNMMCTAAGVLSLSTLQRFFKASEHSTPYLVFTALFLRIFFEL